MIEVSSDGPTRSGAEDFAAGDLLFRIAGRIREGPAPRARRASR
jgi:hypothetical protein